MAKIWITYSWKDNHNNEVDFIAQELEKEGHHPRLDRWDIGAGQRLWEQIAHFICTEGESDAWIIVATQNSLTSEPCKEEFYIALQRAIDSRGTSFPIIALFQGPVDTSLLPASLKLRLCVTMQDIDWLERVTSAAERRDHVVKRPALEPYVLEVHHTFRDPQYAGQVAIEVRPRAGQWAPFFFAYPTDEFSYEPRVARGPAGVPTQFGIVMMRPAARMAALPLTVLISDLSCTTTDSFFFWSNPLPSNLCFGEFGDERKQFRRRFRERSITEEEWELRKIGKGKDGPKS